MSEHQHTKTDGLGDAPMPAGADPWRSRPRNERMGANKIECNACPVLCQIGDSKVGACDRYANQAGVLVRVDPVLLMRKAVDAGEGALVPFVAASGADASLSVEPESAGDVFVTAVGA
ncbi:MAG TPA: 6-hydroxynicotinate reductase, partial [Burkholderiaceae bacterium]